ncbi:hypothetical protein OGAPHI_004747 [Ogataea philodendri]|uniref:Uncharacterized protein n=1 Tax=Ogataea philodendri TaxID=1378263 RepID=A0A9P8P1X5_9ASCO|nr:uncharacterized protein OGAPHI_004747 [Ogataea philodendri]KAH3664033.1 hypothetical protein OGAPHI_004747 [Ogataea philodendri]
MGKEVLLPDSGSGFSSSSKLRDVLIDSDSLASEVRVSSLSVIGTFDESGLLLVLMISDSCDMADEPRWLGIMSESASTLCFVSDSVVPDSIDSAIELRVPLCAPRGKPGDSDSRYEGSVWLEDEFDDESDSDGVIRPLSDCTYSDCFGFGEARPVSLNTSEIFLRIRLPIPTTASSTSLVLTAIFISLFQLDTYFLVCARDRPSRKNGCSLIWAISIRWSGFF